MPLDKELYRKAYESLRQWNEAELIDRVRNAGKRPPGKVWEQYIDLFEFGRQIGLRPSQRQREQRLAEWDDYYARIRKLEAWRRTHGRKS